METTDIELDGDLDGASECQGDPDDSTKELPGGEAGEIAIKGPQNISGLTSEVQRERAQVTELP